MKIKEKNVHGGGQIILVLDEPIQIANRISTFRDQNNIEWYTISETEIQSVKEYHHNDIPENIELRETGRLHVGGGEIPKLRNITIEI